MDYARFILFGAPFLMCSLGMNNMLRFQGNSFYSIIGFGQGFQTVCGFNYGARNYKRVRDAYYFSLKTCTMILIVFAVFTFLFAQPIVTLFRREDAEVIRIGTLALRL